MTDNINLLFLFGAGLASVLSPCVLPVLPIVVTGRAEESRFRPLLIVSGLTFTFILMGIVSSLFGSVIGSKIFFVEKVAAVVIVIFGALLVADVNIFKHFSFLSAFAQNSRGSFGGFLLGSTLGIIWIPCVGPMLSSVLAMVASKGQMVTGAGYLLVYSAGFAVPMLLAGYASQFFRKRMSSVGKYPRIVSGASGIILIALGIFIYFKGMIGFGM